MSELNKIIPLDFTFGDLATHISNEMNKSSSFSNLIDVNNSPQTYEENIKEKNNAQLYEKFQEHPKGNAQVVKHENIQVDSHEKIQPQFYGNAQDHPYGKV